MANTIKVIDLLNKLANGEEAPKKIEYSGREWRLGINDNKDTDYINDKNIGLFYEYLDSILIECLNDTLEIIEEQQDIDIQNLHDINIDEVMTLDNDKRIITALANINVLIQAAKQTDRNIKDKE